MPAYVLDVCSRARARTHTRIHKLALTRTHISTYGHIYILTDTSCFYIIQKMQLTNGFRTQNQKEKPFCHLTLIASDIQGCELLIYK